MPDVILSDHSLNRFDSIEALELCQAQQLIIPFILVTGAVSEEFAADCMRRGADDYILKSNLKRLPASLQNAIRYKESEKARVRAFSDLASQNQELSKTNKEVDSLVYSVSHNLRAPLASVLGLINLAKKERDLKILQDYHLMMESTICKLEDTLKDIINYSRNARKGLQIQRVDLRALLHDTLDKMYYMPGFKRLDIRLAIDQQEEFRSDYFRMSVIMINLVSNAIKYLDDKKDISFLEVRIVVNREAVLLEFRDNGIGIDPTLLPKIFEMFFRANTEQDGSGLGLFIVKEAVEKLQGRVHVESDVGKGTVFSLQIPNFLDDTGEEQL